MPPGPENWSWVPSWQLPAWAAFVSQFIALQYGEAPKPLFDEFDTLGLRPSSVAKTSAVPDVSSRRKACQSAPFAGVPAPHSDDALTPLAWTVVLGEQPPWNMLLQLETRLARAGLL